TVHTNGALLNLRAGTPTTSAIRGTLRDGSTVTILCQHPGQQFKGAGRPTCARTRFSNGLYASDAYIKRSSTPPRCTEPVATTQRSEERRVGKERSTRRAGTPTTTTIRGTLRDGSTVTIVCQQPGQQIKGDVRTTNRW